MTRFLNTILNKRFISSQRQAAIKVLLAMTDLERNVRAGVLTLEDLQQKIQGTLQPGEIAEAATWLASGGVRLITPVEKDGEVGYELAHERLIPALREVVRKDLTTADKANQLLERRVNEWLENNRDSRYLFNWRELRLIQQQKPYLVWGANRSYKEKLLQHSRRKLYRQLVAVGIALVFCLLVIVWWHQQLVAVGIVFLFCLVSMVWWRSPWGQIQQVRWELASLSKRVNYEYRQKAALAFVRDNNLEQALTITDSIENSRDKAPVLVAIAETYGKLDKFPEADQYFGQALSTAKQIDDIYDQATVLVAIVETIGKLENCNLAVKYLKQALHAIGIFLILTLDSHNTVRVLTAIAQTYGKLEDFEYFDACLESSILNAEGIGEIYDKALALVAIAETYGKLDKFPEAGQYIEQALTAAQEIDDLYCKARILTAIAETYDKLEKFPETDQYLGQALSTAEQIKGFTKKLGYYNRNSAYKFVELENSKRVSKYNPIALSALDAFIEEPFHKALALKAIVETIGKLRNFSRAGRYLGQAITTAQKITDSEYKARVLTAIAETYGKLGNFELADKYLGQAITAAKEITDSSYKASVLRSISQIQAKLSRWRQAHNTVSFCPTDECKVECLANILTAWAEKKNPALVDKD